MSLEYLRVSTAKYQQSGSKVKNRMAKIDMLSSFLCSLFSLPFQVLREVKSQKSNLPKCNQLLINSCFPMPPPATLLVDATRGKMTIHNVTMDKK